MGKLMQKKWENSMDWLKSQSTSVNLATPDLSSAANKFQSHMDKLQKYGTDMDVQDHPYCSDRMVPPLSDKYYMWA